MKRLHQRDPLTLALSPKGRGDKESCLSLRESAHQDGTLRRRQGKRDRTGYSLLEMIVAMILLGSAMTIIVPTLGWMGVQNRLSLQRQDAIEGLRNLMEDLASRPYDELTAEAAGRIELPANLKSQLPGAKLEVEITESVKDKEPPAKRIQIRLGWNQRNGRPLAPVRLSAWVHQQEAQP